MNQKEKELQKKCDKRDILGKYQKNAWTDP